MHSRDAVAKILLRPYQAKAMGQIFACRDRGLKRVLAVLPTGTGKTTLFSALIGEIYRESKASTLVLAHRRELLEQAANRIHLQNPKLSVDIEGNLKNRPEKQNVLVGSVQSLGRENTTRLGEWKPGCLIIDEAHHAPADSYQNVMRSVGAYDGGCFTVGVTATPHRMDNRPLHGEEEAIFEEVAFTYTLREAIADGWLADLKGFRVATGVDLSRVRIVHGDYSSKQLQEAVNTESRNRTAFENWVNIAKERKTIVFCTGVEHAKSVAELFRLEGFTAESVDGSMKLDERSKIMSRFATGRIQILTNVEIATEGFDVPDVGCVLLLRPTKSWALFCQMIGRGLRVLPNTIEGLPDADARRDRISRSDKSDCIVIDVVDNGKKLSGPKPEKEDEAPSLSAVVGLPPDFDLEGHSLLEAMQKWDQLDPRAQAMMFRRNVNFDELDNSLTAVDLIAELTPPDEIIGVSRNAWMKVGDGRYLLACGSSRLEGHRMAAIEEDALSFYHLVLTSASREPMEFELGRDLQDAFHVADRRIKDIWPFTNGLTLANTRWRNNAVTQDQKDELRRMGVEETVLAMLDTAGQAWTLMELKKRELSRN
ncbi:MAG: DEAD/DEAH box helicase [Armatimonadetes bacterium]|nr:DEAD/DEAH box helicase [Armatimonadota bacterium]MBS1727134.1 DEAD/DEAH box helicase [Armatimonadota bacterium]